MDIADSIFNNKTADFEKLAIYGFEKENGIYSYKTYLSDSGFKMLVYVTDNGGVSAKVIDPAFDEPYTLHIADSAEGSFVGQVRSEYEAVLRDICDKCFKHEVFREKQTKTVINYVRNTYGDELEFLWQKFPDNAIIRRKDNSKWYAVFLTVSRRKLGFDSDEKVEIIDLRTDSENIEATVDGVRIFPGYHMNKKHWITMCLDDSFSTEEIFLRIDKSYSIAEK